MEKDRRWSRRKTLPIDVALYYSGLGLLRCKIRDISMDGVFIETGRIVLSHATTLELVFTARAPKHSGYRRLSAKIARVGHDGAGLAFTNIDEDSYHFLRELLREGAEKKPLPRRVGLDKLANPWRSGSNAEVAETQSMRRK